MNGVGDGGPETLFVASIETEQDVFALRRFGKAAAEAAGMENQDQVRFATALSELGRDLLRSAPLTAEFSLAEQGHPVLRVRLRWSDRREPTTPSLEAAGRLVARVHYSPGDATGSVTIEHLVARADALGGRAEHIRQTLHERAAPSLVDGLRAQTRDLIAALEESRAQREELARLNQELAETNQGVVALYSELSRELEETNRGVVALYAELEEKSLLLREASESKTRFWSNVSHELRTPVNSVIGLTRLLLDRGSEPLTAEQRRQVTLIGASGSTLLALVDELLDVAKAEAGQMQPEYTEVDLPALLALLRGIMQGVAAQSDVRLVIADPPGASGPHGPHGLPGLVTDEVMLTRILRNLLSNGLKFTPRGEVRLEVRAESPEWLLFTVSDTGVGIPEDQQARVFEEFYQVTGPHQRGRSGTGLGLPYARRLAGLLGGDLTLSSTPGHGTSVSLRLPVRPDSAPDAGTGAPVARLRVVVTADDDPVFREAFRPVLEQLAERVVEVSEGALVVETARRERPDAILVDLNMPGTDGYAVVAALAADPALSAIPVLVVTSAELSAAAAERLGHAGAVVSKRGLTAHRLAGLLGLTGLTGLTGAPSTATNTTTTAASTLTFDVHPPAETAPDDPL